MSANNAKVLNIDKLKQKSDKLVVFDIDGTLTDKSGLVIEVIKFIRLLKCKVVFASGRNLSALFFFAKDIGRKDAILIAENGGVYKLPDEKNEILVFKNKTLNKIVKFLIEGKYVKEKPEHSHTRSSDCMFNKNDFLEPVDKINEILKQKFNGKFILTDSGSAHIHLHATRITKGSTLSKLAKLFKISKTKIIVFGNADNDIEMFKTAKTSVCVDRAPNLEKISTYNSINKAGKGVVEGLLIYIFNVKKEKAIEYVNQL